MDLKSGFIFLVGFVVVQRLIELRVSRKNEKQMVLRGGVIAPNKDMPIMVILHTLWLTYCVYLASTLELKTIEPKGFYIFASLFFVGQTLRLLAIDTLGDRWCVKVISIPDFAPVNSGIFKFIKHPNYLGVIIEIFALPLVVGGIYGAIIFSILNGLLLSYRIKSEEAFLNKHTDYDHNMITKSKFIPKVL